MVDGEGGSSEGLKWSGEGLLRDLSKSILKQGGITINISC